jgi:hypothetical protein
MDLGVAKPVRFKNKKATVLDLKFVLEKGLNKNPAARSLVLRFVFGKAAEHLVLLYLLYTQVL